MVSYDWCGLPNIHCESTCKALQEARSQSENSWCPSMRIPYQQRRSTVFCNVTIFNNILAEMVMKEALKGFKSGISIGRRRITNLWYVDMLASPETELQDLVNRVEWGSGKQDCWSWQQTVSRGIKHSAGTNGYISYLGSMITMVCECSKDVVTSWLAKGQAISAAMKNQWKGHNVKIPTKMWKH